MTRVIKTNHIKHFISCIMIFVFVIILLTPISLILERKASNTKYVDYIKQEGNFDVLFLGTSRAMDAFLPNELWLNYGITSYNFGNQGCNLPVEYWNLVEALSYAKPEIVVVDAYSIDSNQKVASIEYTHEALDWFPFSTTKIKAVTDLFNNDGVDVNGVVCRERQLEYLWDFILYHNRWAEITESDFNFDGHPESGAISLFKVFDYTENGTDVEKPDNYETVDLNSIGAEYLCKIIELCKNNDIDVIITYLPNATGDNEYNKAYTVRQLADQYDVEYIDFLNDKENIVDYYTNLADASHLNYAGGCKITNYIGNILNSKFALSDKRTEGKFGSNATHETILSYYLLAKQYWVNDQNDLYTILMLLQDDYYNFEIYVSDAKFLDDITLYNAINQLPEGNIIIDCNLENNVDIMVKVTDSKKSFEQVKCYVWSESDNCWMIK